MARRTSIGRPLRTCCPERLAGAAFPGCTQSATLKTRPDAPFFLKTVGRTPCKAGDSPPLSPLCMGSFLNNWKKGRVRAREPASRDAHFNLNDVQLLTPRSYEARAWHYYGRALRETAGAAEDQRRKAPKSSRVYRSPSRAKIIRFRHIARAPRIRPFPPLLLRWTSGPLPRRNFSV